MRNDNNVILIVDDTPTNLRILFEHLKKAGFKTLVATNGVSALERIPRTQPDLILLDVMMPDMNGFEVCRRLKINETTRHIPVIFMTARSDLDSKVRAFEAGGVDYVTKPLEYREVLARVQTHLALQNAQKELNMRLEQLQAHNSELNAFAHTVAHDLANPVSIILGFAHTLVMEYPGLDDEVRSALEAISRTARRLDNIIEALLLLAGVRQTDAIPVEPLDMAEIVTATLERLTNLFEEYEAELIQPDSWPVALGYAPWVEEVWVNYISNGLKYGRRPVRLELGADNRSDGMIRFWVRDNGQGLTPEEQSRLFVPFERLSQVRIEGHGLGLSIVQRIVTKLGGAVGVESEVGRGSIFSFTLPAAGE